MKEIPLQQVMLPVSHICDIHNMYFRQNGDCLFDDYDGLIIAQKGGKISFDTFFNIFSIAKWKRYTRLAQFSLKLTIKGSFIVSVRSVQLVNSSIYKKTILVEKLSCDDISSFSIRIPDEISETGLYFELKAVEDDSVFYSGQYYINADDYYLNPVQMGIAICTYKREDFITKNINVLEEAILENPNSSLYGFINVFISDNGKSLDINAFKSPFVHVYHNINAGGTSGFTRAILEMKNSNCDISHVLIMDDDITIDVESIRKTYMILALLKDEYSETFIGGSMLRLDRQFELVESGAIWNQGSLESNKRGLNLTKLDHVMINDIEEYTEYNAWWYCCFPFQVTENDNLPLPIFIRGDDVEYGLRNTKNLILMNGICVWHEPFENKYSSWVNYYVFRNQLIVNALHVKPKKSNPKTPTFSNTNSNKSRHFLSFLFRRLVREVLYFRYQDAFLIIKGVNDYLKGIDFLMQKNPVELHREIMKMGIKLVPLENSNINYSLSRSYGKNEHRHEMPRKRSLRIFLLNGYLLPFGKNKIVSVQDICIRDFGFAKRVLFIDESAQTGVILTRSWRKALEVFMSFAALSIHYLACNTKTQNEFKLRLREVTNSKYWIKILELEKMQE